MSAEQRSWRDPANGLVHRVMVEAFRCHACPLLHVRGDLLTDCGIDLDLVHDEHEEPTCIACREVRWLDGLADGLRVETLYGEPVIREETYRW